MRWKACLCGRLGKQCGLSNSLLGDRQNIGSIYDDIVDDFNPKQVTLSYPIVHNIIWWPDVKIGELGLPIKQIFQLEQHLIIDQVHIVDTLTVCALKMNKFLQLWLRQLVVLTFCDLVLAREGFVQLDEILSPLVQSQLQLEDELIVYAIYNLLGALYESGCRQKWAQVLL